MPLKTTHILFQLSTNYFNTFNTIICTIWLFILNHQLVHGKAADLIVLLIISGLITQFSVILTSFDTDDSNTSTRSDHKILISSWTFPYAFIGKHRATTKTRRRIFLYKNMNNEQWQTYSDQISSNLKANKTPLSIDTSETLEYTWHKIQTSIINAALQHIPNKKFTVRNFQHIYSPKASLLHQHLKKLGNIIRQVKVSLKNKLSIPTQHNSTINLINSTHQLNIPYLPNKHTLLANWLNN